MKQLTVKQLDAAKPQATEYKLTVDRGLYLRVATDGGKTWLVRYVVDGKQRQARLPQPYGSIGAGCMSLADARSENARIQALARSGVDFQVQAQHQRETLRLAAVQASADNATVHQLWAAWMADGVSRKDGNAELERSFKKDVLSRIGHRALKDVTEADLRSLLRAVVARGVNRTAVSLSRDIKQMFSWAEKRQPWRKLLADGNPADLIEVEKLVSPDYDMSNQRSRTLNPDEIRELRDIFAAMQAGYAAAPDRRTATRPMLPETQLALWISLSTACRIGELLLSEWADVDLKAGVWFIPKANVKGSLGKTQDQTVHLSSFSLRQFKLLHERTGKSRWCFPARDDGSHVCLKSVSKQVGDRQESFKDRKPLKNRRHDNSLVLAGGKRGDWTPHDLRRTAATMMQALGVVPDVIDRCQNHVMAGSKVRRHYLTHEYAAEKRAAWQLLGDQLDTILRHPDASGATMAQLPT